MRTLTVIEHRSVALLYSGVLFCRLLIYVELNKNKYILKHSTYVCQHLVHCSDKGMLTQRSDQPRRVHKKILLRNRVEEDLETMNREPSIYGLLGTYTAAIRQISQKGKYEKEEGQPLKRESAQCRGCLNESKGHLRKIAHGSFSQSEGS